MLPMCSSQSGSYFSYIFLSDSVLTQIKPLLIPRLFTSLIFYSIFNIDVQLRELLCLCAHLSHYPQLQ